MSEQQRRNSAGDCRLLCLRLRAFWSWFRPAGWKEVDWPPRSYSEESYSAGSFEPPISSCFLRVLNRSLADWMNGPVASILPPLGGLRVVHDHDVFRGEPGKKVRERLHSARINSENGGVRPYANA